MVDLEAIVGAVVQAVAAVALEAIVEDGVEVVVALEIEAVAVGAVVEAHREEEEVCGRLNAAHTT